MLSGLKPLYPDIVLIKASYPFNTYYAEYFLAMCIMWLEFKNKTLYI